LRYLVVEAAIPLLVLGCASGAGTANQGVDLEAEGATLLDKDRSLAEAYVTGDDPLETWFASAADDLRLLAPDIPITVGREASRAVFEELEALPGYSLRYTPQMAEVSGTADLGYTIGTYQMTVPGADGELEEVTGKYLTVWRRQADGSWKAAVDMFNADKPSGSAPN